MINYSKLGRSNKHILNGLFELCKQKNKGEGFEPFIVELECIIFERSRDP